MTTPVNFFGRPLSVGLGFAGLLVCWVGGLAAEEPGRPLRFKPGPQLFLDDCLIAESSFLTRVVNQPQKLPQPVVTGGKHGDENFQLYVSVVRDPRTKRFRMWYNTGEDISVTHCPDAVLPRPGRSLGICSGRRWFGTGRRIWVFKTAKQFGFASSWIRRRFSDWNSCRASRLTGTLNRPTEFAK